MYERRIAFFASLLGVEPLLLRRNPYEGMAITIGDSEHEVRHHAAELHQMDYRTAGPILISEVTGDYYQWFKKNSS